MGTAVNCTLYTNRYKLGRGFKHFLFLPLPGEMIQFDLRIFFKWIGLTSKLLREQNKAKEITVLLLQSCICIKAYLHSRFYRNVFVVTDW